MSIIKLYEKWQRHWRRWRLRNAGAQIAHDLQSKSKFFSGNAKGFSCANGVFISEGARISIGEGPSGFGKLCLGSCVFINHYAFIDCHYRIDIGQFAQIGPHVYIGDFDHDFDGDVAAIGKCDAVVVGDRAWIGANAVILKGVTIGENAVVAAGAVVTRSVDPWTVVAGVPAQAIRKRLPDDE